MFALKKVTVEQIHKEFDDAEEQIIKDCENLLNSLNISTEAQIERKGKLLKSLGFKECETVVSFTSLENKKQVTEQQLLYINNLKVRYPNYKFITLEEFERICKKYKLIYAPVANYIKDVPEKNVLEMTNRTLLWREDIVKTCFTITEVEFFNNQNSRYRKWFNNRFINKPLFYNLDRWYFGREYLTKIVNKEYPFTDDFGNHCCSGFNFEESNLEGLYIAAPKSHFNLKGLKKKSKFGFFKVESFESKDPIVFEYLQKGICRIVTKWGTDDDQSYLDPILINETNN